MIKSPLAKFEYLRKFETEFKKKLGKNQGSIWGRFRKNSETTNLVLLSL